MKKVATKYALDMHVKTFRRLAQRYTDLDANVYTEGKAVYVGIEA